MKTETELTNKIVALVVSALFAILGVRLFHLQIIKGKGFRQLSHDNRLRVEKVPSPRGIIYDRNGRPLVENSPYFSVSLIPEFIGRADIKGISDFLNIDLKELYRIVEKWEHSIEPIKLKDGLSFDEVAFMEARLSDFPELMIDVEQTRHYLYGSVGSHLIGYLGKLKPSQVGKEDLKDVPRQAMIGQWGVEKLFDNRLRGNPGRKAFEVDALGRKIRKFSEELPDKGEDVYLSIDIELQRTVEEAFGDRAGALVAIKPDSGEVLAMASSPSFDPNLFSRGISYDDWVRLAEDKRFPMLNRALQSQYPPGSTFKIITAVAALETGSMAPDTPVTCYGQIRHGPWAFRCWKRGGHGTLSLHRALVESCDVYFYTAGGKAGIDSIAHYAREFGMGRPAGIDLVKEKTGLVPDTEWKKRVKNEPWYPGETYNASIGQGFVLATPVQLARMTAAVASGGYLYEPRILRTEYPPPPPEHTVRLDEGTIAALQYALRGVVSEPHGTGYAAKSRLYEVSGKTGTAQVIAQKEPGMDEDDLPARFRDHAWFVAYAPSDQPEIAMAVFVEHGGHGGSTAAPIARAAIETYLNGLPKPAPPGGGS